MYIHDLIIKNFNNMKKLVLVIALVFVSISEINAQVEYKIITSVESIVPNGVGRSRLVSTSEDRNYKDFTSVRSDDKKEDKRNKSDRGDIRVKNFEETKLLNFYNIGGIRFQNIAANDAVLSSKINTMIEEGWELAFVTSAVESEGGKGDGKGIFITRFIFKRDKA